MLLMCVGSAYLFVISSAGTKLEWYAAPLFPVLCGTGGDRHLCSIRLVAKRELSSTAQLRGRVLPYLFLFVVFVGPYSSTVGRVLFPEGVGLG